MNHLFLIVFKFKRFRTVTYRTWCFSLENCDSITRRKNRKQKLFHSCDMSHKSQYWWALIIWWGDFDWLEPNVQWTKHPDKTELKMLNYLNFVNCELWLRKQKMPLKVKKSYYYLTSADHFESTWMTLVLCFDIEIDCQTYVRSNYFFFFLSHE